MRGGSTYNGGADSRRIAGVDRGQEEIRKGQNR